MRSAAWAVVALLASGAAEATPRKLFAFCVPDAPGSARVADRYLEPFFRSLERTVGWPDGALVGKFTTSARRCHRLLRQKKTVLAAMTLGLYLAHRKRFGLVPLAVVEMGGRPTSRYHVVVKKGRIASLADLEDARIWTSHGADPKVVARIILEGKLGDSLKVRRVRQPLRALRAVKRGEAKATIVNDAELDKMKLLPLAEDLEVIHSSAPLPNPLVVAVGKRLGGSLEGLAAKIRTLCRADNRAGCENLPLTGFAAPDRAALEALEEKYTR